MAFTENIRLLRPLSSPSEDGFDEVGAILNGARPRPRVDANPRIPGGDGACLDPVRVPRAARARGAGAPDVPRDRVQHAAEARALRGHAVRGGDRERERRAPGPRGGAAGRRDVDEAPGREPDA